MVLIFLPLVLYLIEVYTVYSASVLAASSVLRSLFGVGEPIIAFSGAQAQSTNASL